MSVYRVVWLLCAIFYVSDAKNSNNRPRNVQKRHYPNVPPPPIAVPIPEPIYNPQSAQAPVVVQEPIYNPQFNYPPQTPPVVFQEPPPDYQPQARPKTVVVQDPAYNQQPVYQPQVQPGTIVVQDPSVYQPQVPPQTVIVQDPFTAYQPQARPQTVVIQDPVYNHGPAQAPFIVQNPVYTPPIVAPEPTYTQELLSYEPGISRVIAQEVGRPQIVDGNVPYIDGSYSDRPRAVLVSPRGGVWPYYDPRQPSVVPIPRPFRYIPRRVVTINKDGEPAEANLPPEPESPIKVNYLPPPKNAVKEVTLPPPVVIPPPEFEPIVDPLQADYDIPGQAGLIWDPLAQTFVPRRVVAPPTRVVIRQPIVIYEPILNPNATLSWDEYPPNIQAKKEAEKDSTKEVSKESSKDSKKEGEPAEAEPKITAKEAADEAVAEATSNEKKRT